jgi:hypothetical protein
LISGHVECHGHDFVHSKIYVLKWGPIFNKRRGVIAVAECRRLPWILWTKKVLEKRHCDIQNTLQSIWTAEKTEISYRKRYILTTEGEFVKKEAPNAVNDTVQCLYLFWVRIDGETCYGKCVRACMFVCECKEGGRGFWYLRNHDEAEMYDKATPFENVFGIAYFIFMALNLKYIFFTSKSFCLLSDEPRSDSEMKPPT